MSRYALTAIGQDKPGIVSAVTRALYDHDCNIEDSSMTILADEFAIILIMSPSDGFDVTSLRDTLDEVEREMSLTIQFKEIEAKSKEASALSSHILTVSGYDRPGIVYKTAQFLAKWGINITDLETKRVQGEEKSLYIMLMEVHFPENLDNETIISSLKTLGESMGVSIEAKPIETYRSL